MARVFGEAFFGDHTAKPDWHYGAADFHRRLAPLLDALELDVQQRVEMVVKSKRARIHTGLRALTQLGKGDSTGIRVNIEVSDYMPPPVLDLLSELPDALLWVLLHRNQIADTVRGLTSIMGNYSQITKADGFQPPEGIGRREVWGTAAFLEALNSTSVRKAEEIVQKIVSLDSDFLGAYFFQRGHIELYWIPIWLVAGQLRVSPEDLAIVVLIHEMAHLYTHVGQDADHECWDTDGFGRSDVEIVEGLAQFYTETLCTQMAKDGDDRPLVAFYRLMDLQPSQYRAHLDWAPNHPKRAEIIRHSLVEIRSLQLHNYSQFRDRIYKNTDGLWR